MFSIEERTQLQGDHVNVERLELSPHHIAEDLHTSLDPSVTSITF
jgi:hypothetical protein